MAQTWNILVDTVVVRGGASEVPMEIVLEVIQTEASKEHQD